MQSENTLQQAQADKNLSFGTRLKMARETMGLERKDAALQLRLNEKYLIMMEKDRFAPDLPLTFARGYLKTYAKFLQIPEAETKKALETLKPKPGTQEHLPIRNLPEISGRNYFMQIFTYLVVFTMIGLAGAWWYTHPNMPSILAGNTLNLTKTLTDKATGATASTEHMQNPVQEPANMPISTTTTTANTSVSPMVAPGTDSNTASNTITTNPVTKTAPITANDVDASIPPVIAPSQIAKSQTESGDKAPAYMNNTKNSSASDGVISNDADTE